MDHEEVAPLALIPDATLEVMLRQSMVAPSDASQLVLVDAFIVRLKAVLSGSDYTTTLSALVAAVNPA
jgi:hypothetical protein